MEIDMSNEMINAVESYLAAKSAFDQAEATLKAAKDAAIQVAGGYGFLEGNTADLDIGLQARKSLNETLLLQYITKDQLAACKVEGTAYPVIRVKAKRIAA